MTWYISMMSQICFLIAVFMMSPVTGRDSENEAREIPVESLFAEILHNVQRRQANTSEPLTACNQSAVDPSRDQDPAYDVPAYRFHALIYGNTTLLCGGAVLNKDWLITSASCLQRLTGTISLVLGYQQLASRVGEQNFFVSNIVYNPKYNASAGNVHDIAMIKVAPSANGLGIQFTNRVQPICLTALECTPSQSLTYTMTGVVRNASEIALNVYPVTMASKQTCINAGAQISQDLICAIKTASITNSCDGFLGGPVIYSVGGFYKLAGIVSSCHRNNAVVIASLQIINCGTEITD